MFEYLKVQRVYTTRRHCAEPLLQSCALAAPRLNLRFVLTRGCLSVGVHGDVPTSRLRATYERQHTLGTAAGIQIIQLSLPLSSLASRHASRETYARTVAAALVEGGILRLLALHPLLPAATLAVVV